MVYLESVNAYLHQSSLLLTAYSESVRITTKYTLPRKTPAPDRRAPSSKVTKKPKSERTPKERKQRPERQADGEKKEPKPKPAILTFKTYEPGSGICLKYSTNKQAEVGRLMLGLGRLAAGETIEEPSGMAAQATAAADDKMDMDGEEAPVEAKPASVAPTGQTTTSSGGGAGSGGKKKKKGKK